MSLRTRLASLLDDARLAVSVAAVGLGALAWVVALVASPFTALRSEDARLRRADKVLWDSLRAETHQRQRADSVRDVASEQLRGEVRSLLIGECLDRPRRETVLMGIPCDRLTGRLGP